MNKQTIPLEREATREDYMAVLNTSDEPCECKPEVAEAYRIAASAGCTSDVDVCKPCAARFVLNGLASLAEKL